MFNVRLEFQMLCYRLRLSQYLNSVMRIQIITKNILDISIKEDMKIGSHDDPVPASSKSHCNFGMNEL